MSRNTKETAFAIDMRFFLFIALESISVYGIVLGDRIATTFGNYLFKVQNG